LYTKIFCFIQPPWATMLVTLVLCLVWQSSVANATCMPGPFASGQYGSHAYTHTTHMQHTHTHQPTSKSRFAGLAGLSRIRRAVRIVTFAHRVQIVETFYAFTGQCSRSPLSQPTGRILNAGDFAGTLHTHIHTAPATVIDTHTHRHAHPKRRRS
jgi:hypothetical protein